MDLEKGHNKFKAILQTPKGLEAVKNYFRSETIYSTNYLEYNSYTEQEVASVADDGTIPDNVKLNYGTQKRFET